MNYVPLLPDHRSLLDRVKTIWGKGLYHLPVHKDLPRLYKGFEIANGRTKQMIYKECNGTANTTCKDIIWTMAVFLPDSPDYLELEKLVASKKEEKHKNDPYNGSIRDTHEEEEVIDDDDSEEDFVRVAAPEAEVEQTIGDEHLEEKDDIFIIEQYNVSTKGGGSGPTQCEAVNNFYANRLVKRYSKYVKSGDLGPQLQRFFLSGAVDPQGKLSSILRCIQQEIIAPSVMDLRMDIYPKMKYKDVPGTWHVRVEFFFDDEVDEETEYSSSGHSSKESQSNGLRDLKKGVVVHTPTTQRRRSSTRHKEALLPSRSIKSDPLEENEEKKVDRPTLGRMASARRFLQKSHSSIAIDLPKDSKINSPLISRKRSKEQKGRNRLRDSSGSIYRKSKKEEIHKSTTPSSPLLLPKKVDEQNDITIENRPIKGVRVLHRKKEQSYGEETETVLFEWELALTFGPDLDNIEEVSLQLTDMSIGDEVGKEKKEDILNLFKLYMSEEFPYVNIWKRPCSKSLSYKEILTCAKIVEVLDVTGNIIHVPSRIKLQAFCLLQTIVSQLKPTCLTKEEVFLTQLSLDNESSVGKTIRNLLNSYVITGSSGGLARILKAFSMEMTVPASSKVKNLIPNAKDHKTVKGSHHIVLRFLEHVIAIAHFFNSTCTLPDHHFFVFEWGFTLSFNQSVSQLISVSYEMIEYSFSLNVPPAIRASVLEAFSSWITPATVETSQSSISVNTAIRCLSTALSRLPAGKEMITDEFLPGGEISAGLLLSLLQQNLEQENLPSISCTSIKQVELGGEM